MEDLWDRLRKCLVVVAVESSRVGLIVVETIVAVLVAPEKIHYVNFVGMMTRNDLVVGNLKNFGFL